MKKLVLWGSTLLILTWGGVQYWPVTVHIRGLTAEENFSIRMPLKDKKRLDFFFRDVCFLNAWSYTLMGSKPMSVHQYTKPWIALRNAIKHPDLKDILFQCFWPPHFQKICYFLTPEQIKIKWGWETLQKYMGHFPDSRFVLYTSGSNDNEIVVLTLIDKTRVIQAIKQHREDFQIALKTQSIELEDLFNNKKLYALLKNLPHEGLYGTLLGFGRDNAWLFFKYREIESQEWPLVSAWQDEEIVNLEQLNQKTFSFQPWELSDVFYPRFACDPQSEETRQLKQTYREEREQIVNYFEGKDLVEATLSLFNRA